MPGTGALLRAVEVAAGRGAEVVGKGGGPYLLEYLRKQHEVEVGRCLMVGDRLDTDVAFGKGAGMRTLLVLSGGERDGGFGRVRGGGEAGSVGAGDLAPRGSGGEKRGGGGGGRREDKTVKKKKTDGRVEMQWNRVVIRGRSRPAVVARA